MRGYLQTRKTIRHRGFTVIELLVVMGIVAILVVLAAPQFRNRTKDANQTAYIHDVRVVEDIVARRLATDPNQWEEWESTTPSHLRMRASQNRLIGLGGPVFTVPIDTYMKLPDTLIAESGHSLTGCFYADTSGNVWYEHDQPIRENPFAFTNQEEWRALTLKEGYKEARDQDFSEQVDEYELPYWQYIGSDPLVIVPDTINGMPVTMTNKMFAETAVKGVAVYNPNITEMRGMFQGTTSKTLDLRFFHTSGVENMHTMFRYAQAEVLDLSSFDTSNVYSMPAMFHLSKATSIDLSSFDTSRVRDMRGMFHTAQAERLDLRHFDTSHVSDMRYMFYRSKATHIDVSRFQTGKVGLMSGMFLDAQAPVLDVSHFDTQSVTNMQDMFYGTKATVLDVSGFQTKNVTNMSLMFYNTHAKVLDMSHFDTTSLEQMNGMFRSSRTPILDLSSFSLGAVTNTDNLFQGAAATVGYARSDGDAAILNASTVKPPDLVFTVR